PYWLPADAVLTQSLSASAITPTDVAVNPARVLQVALPATVVFEDTGRAVLSVNAPSLGYVYDDRSWYPTWQVTVDGHGIAPYQALGGELIPVQAGRHVIEERLVPWDAGLGLAIGFMGLAVAGIWLALRRRQRNVVVAAVHVGAQGRHSTAPSLDLRRGRRPGVAWDVRARAARTWRDVVEFGSRSGA